MIVCPAPDPALLDPPPGVIVGVVMVEPLVDGEVIGALEEELDVVVLVDVEPVLPDEDMIEIS